MSEGAVLQAWVRAHVQLGAYATRVWANVSGCKVWVRTQAVGGTCCPHVSKRAWLQGVGADTTA